MADMISKCIRKFSITVDDFQSDVQQKARYITGQKFTINIEYVESGGCEFGYLKDEGYGVRTNGIAISCKDEQACFIAAKKLVAILVSATMRLGNE